MIVRAAGAGDAEAIVLIHAACFALAWSRASIQSLIDDPHAFIFAAEDPFGQIVGYLSARDVFDGYELLNVAVLPEHRGRGYGQKLIDTLFSSLPQRVPLRIYLEVRESNESARRLYERCGFSVFARRERYYPDTDEAAFLMVYVTPQEDGWSGRPS